MQSTMFDFMAERFRALGKPAYPLADMLRDAEIAGHLDVWDVTRTAIANALVMRGLALADGEITELPGNGQHYDPVDTEFAEFTSAAARVMKDAEHPLDAVDLISLTGLSEVAIPMANMTTYLKRVGIFFIPGVGYWTAPQYTNPAGRLVSAPIRDERVSRLMRYFESHGWPIAGRDAERDTGGIVSSRFIARYASGEGRSQVMALGAGLYAPTSKAADGALPVSRGVAQALLALEQADMIDDHDHLRLFKLALILARRGLATIKKSRTTRAGIRRQTVKLTLTDAGRAMLDRNARLAKDEF